MNSPAVDQFDFCPQSVPKAFSVAATVILGLAIVLGGVSVGLPEFLRVEPTIRNDTSGLNDSFNLGYSQLCYDNTGCEQLPMAADGDEVFNRFTNLRLSAYGLHICALLLSGLVLLGCIVVLALWFSYDNDNWPFRLSRLIFGIVLMLSGLLLLIAILLFHIEQFEDKWYKSERIKYGFNHWNEDQRTTTDVSFGSSYVLIWVAAVLFFVCSWMLLGTFCCWTRDIVDVESSEVSLRLPRLRPVSSGSSNPMLTAEH